MPVQRGGLRRAGFDRRPRSHTPGSGAGVPGYPPPSKLGGICLIAAPFIGGGGWPSDDIRARSDLAERLPSDVPVFLYHGAKDEIVPVSHVHLYAKAIPRAVVRMCEHNDHQLNNDMSQVARDIRSLTLNF